MLSLQFYATVNVIVIVFLTSRKLSSVALSEVCVYYKTNLVILKPQLTLLILLLLLLFGKK